VGKEAAGRPLNSVSGERLAGSPKQGDIGSER